MELFIAGALALVAGIAFGVFGAGGSILLVPILIYILNLPVKVALGMALLILVMTGSLASLAHARSGNINWKVGAQWSVVSVGCAYLGGRAAGWIPPVVLITMFAVIVVVASTAMMRRRAPEAYRREGRSELATWKVVAVGAGLGLLTGVIGVGGGFLLVPALVLLCNVDVKKAIGTSLLIIAANSAGGFLGFAAHTSFPIALTSTIAGFNALGSLIGERIGKPLPSHRLRPAFAVFLLVVGAVMVIQNLVDIFSGRAL